MLQTQVVFFLDENVMSGVPRTSRSQGTPMPRWYVKRHDVCGRVELCQRLMLMAISERGLSLYSFTYILDHNGDPDSLVW